MPSAHKIVKMDDDDDDDDDNDDDANYKIKILLWASLTQPLRYYSDTETCSKCGIINILLTNVSETIPEAPLAEPQPQKTSKLNDIKQVPNRTLLWPAYNPGDALYRYTVHSTLYSKAYRVSELQSTFCMA